ncbi:hypothetical protein ACQPUZ_17315 [Clostridium tertium]
MINKISENAPLVLMVTIVNRDKLEKVESFFTNEGITFNLSSLGMGTTNPTILDYFGLGEVRKVIVLSTMPLGVSKSILKKLESELKLDKNGNGIAFTITITSICGSRTCRVLTGASHIEGGDNMEEVNKHDLIIAVTNRGYSDDVMEAAKLGNASGGTVIHARGMGLKEAEKFFGVAIHPEKEVILILTLSKFRADIMKSICSKTGFQTEAKTIAFSLPVNEVAGLPTFFQENNI